MLMRTKVLIGGGLAALAIASGSIVWGVDHVAAQSTSAPQQQATATPQPTTTTGPAHGRRPGHGRGAPGVVALVRAAADLTGQQPKDIMAQLRQGQSLAQVAAAKGSSGDAVVQAATATVKARLDKAVAAGRITQAQADERLNQFTTKAATLVNDTTLGSHGAAQGGRHGARALINTTARLTGLQRQEVVAALRNGQSIAEIAAAHGSSGDAVVNAVADKLKAQLDKAVAAGRITQAQADERLAQARTRLADAVNKP